MKRIIKYIINKFFVKLIGAFMKVFYAIKDIKANPIDRLTQIASNLTTCLSVIMSIVILIMYYIKYGISFKFSNEISSYYYNNIFTAMFFITVIISIIFIFVNHFKNSDEKHTIPVIIFTIIFLIASSLYTYIALGATNVISVNETFGTLITFGNPHEGFMLAATIYLVISLVSLFIDFAFMKQWGYVINILFGCLMFIVILPILVYFISNLAAVLSAIVIGLIISFITGFTFSTVFDQIEEEYYNQLQTKYIVEALKKDEELKYKNIKIKID